MSKISLIMHFGVDDSKELISDAQRSLSRYPKTVQRAITLPRDLHIQPFPSPLFFLYVSSICHCTDSQVKIPDWDPEIHEKSSMMCASNAGTATGCSLTLRRHVPVESKYLVSSEFVNVVRVSAMSLEGRSLVSTHLLFKKIVSFDELVTTAS